jgi:hypothetical protein
MKSEEPSLPAVRWIVWLGLGRACGWLPRNNANAIVCAYQEILFDAALHVLDETGRSGCLLRQPTSSRDAKEPAVGSRAHRPKLKQIALVQNAKSDGIGEDDIDSVSVREIFDRDRKPAQSIIHVNNLGALGKIRWASDDVSGERHAKT